MLHITFYAPVEHVEAVKEAMFAQGAGKIGSYDRCSFQTLGDGQFRPLGGSDPYVGSQGMLERVKEFKVEMVCEESVVTQVIAALKSSHPYETPAYYVIKTLSY
jgi:hypothetical protein